jgi:hypothetical protein
MFLRKEKFKKTKTVQHLLRPNGKRYESDQNIKRYRRLAITKFSLEAKPVYYSFRWYIKWKPKLRLR